MKAKSSPLVKNALKEGLIEFERVKQIGTLSKKEHNKRLRISMRSELKRILKDYNYSRGIVSIPQEFTRGELTQLTQNKARTIIEKMEIPETILSQPFEQLNNNELRLLSKKLDI